MSITEKLQIIAENQQSVYEAGYAAGAQLDADSLFQYITGGAYMFQNAIFPDGYTLVVNIPNIKSDFGQFLSYAKGVKKLVLKGNTANNGLNCGYAFRGDYIEEIDFSEFGNGGLKATYLNGAFGAKKLHTISGELDLSAAVNIGGAFDGAVALQNVRFKPLTIAKSISFRYSSLLTTETIQSILDGLADLTEADTQTLTLHANIVLTEEQTNTITAKNWTLVQ